MNLTIGDAATLGATSIDGNVMVGGNLTAGAAILVGVKSKINGNLVSRTASADLCASAEVGRSAIAATALTLGADATVGASKGSWIALARTGAVALDERALVGVMLRPAPSLRCARMQ
jgi:hypothetical protein